MDPAIFFAWFRLRKGTKKTHWKRETNRLLAETEPKIHADKQNTKGFGFSLTLGPLKRISRNFRRNRHQPHGRKRAMEEDLGLDNNLEVFAGIDQG